MRKFTVFTLMTSIVVLVVGADIFANDVLPKYKKPVAGESEAVFDLPDSLPSMEASEIGGANVLGSDVSYDGSGAVDQVGLMGNGSGTVDQVGLMGNGSGAIDRVPLPGDEYENVELLTDDSDTELLLDDSSYVFDDDIYSVNEASIPSYSATMNTADGGSVDFEDDNFVPFSTNVLIREDQIRSAGFVSAYLEQEAHEGFLFRTIYIDDLYDVTTSKYVIKSEDQALAKVYVFQIGPLSSLGEVYDVIKMRATEGLDMEINETNDFGDGSFYMNDLRRSNVAFLTVKIGANIYGFSYPKEYHSQISNLIKLLDMEF